MEPGKKCVMKKAGIYENRGVQQSLLRVVVKEKFS